MSKVVGQPLAKRLMPEKMAEWRQKVQHHSDDLFNYILFLRITPFLPNWFINLTGPLVGVPLKPFFWGSVIGVAPLSMLAVQAGQTLYTLTSTSDTVTFKSIIFVVISAIASVLPIYFKRKDSKFSDASQTEIKTK
ncbi:Oidioi.mRNA.OKI2018_I69.chr1.g2309.t1.cds [Oikopleura dioica]|uniref:Transmembrane protein 41B n=1 Tax=Oikopleura dioica TaxID=34765 RepID=A0ABN7SW33_OIKDI|nr:Oidioi.mRNA.OKI2018_I69.chr1.g2309.t1.cds [Oikopleura dioica]